MDSLKNIGILLVVAVLAAGMGYYFAPTKIKTEEKIVEKEVTKKEEYHKKTKKYDKDGHVIEESDETGNKETNSNSTKTEKKQEITKDQKQYAVKAGIVQSLNKTKKPTYRVGAEVRLPIFNSWLGGEADIDVGEPKGGVYLRMEF